MQKTFTQDQACGMLIGLAVGDALGAAATGAPRDDVVPVATMAGGGPHGLAPGQWGPSTSMAMCLAQMLRSANGWDAEDAMKRFVNWRDHGYLSSTRVCFGMDADMARALHAFEATGNPYGGTREAKGNAGLVRLAPVVLAYGASKDSAMAVAQLQCRLTHAAPAGMRGAANLAQVMVTGNRALLPKPEAPPETTGDDVLDTLHAAFWALGQGETFQVVLQAAVGLGGHADRVGAVTGQLAGRFFGLEGIPDDWRAVLHDHDKILKAAEDLYAMRPIDV